MDRRWLLGGFGFLVAIAYIPWISGAAVTTRWVVLAIGCWLMMSNEPPRVNWKLARPMLALLGWMLLTLLWSEQPYDGVNAAIHLVIITACVLFGACTSDPRPLYLGFAAGVAFLGFPLDLYYPDPNLLGETAVVALVALCTQWPDKTRAFIAAILLAAMFYSKSRASFLGLACVVIAASSLVSWRAAIVLSLSSISVVVATLAFGQWGSLTDRINIWHDTAAGVTWLGHGLGSFRNSVGYYGGWLDVLSGIRPDHAHNDLLEIAFESGIVGASIAIAAFAILIARTWGERESYILIASLGCAMATFQLHLPSTVFLAAFALGRLLRRDRVWGDDPACGLSVPAVVDRRGHATRTGASQDRARGERGGPIPIRV